MDWTAHSQYPYCKLIEELGPTEDKENFAKVIMFQNGVSFESFPKNVVSQAKSIAKDFDKILKAESKIRTKID